MISVGEPASVWFQNNDRGKPASAPLQIFADAISMRLTPVPAGLVLKLEREPMEFVVPAVFHQVVKVVGAAWQVAEMTLDV